MYQPGTILAPRAAGERLRVIGPSPVSPLEGSEWGASSGGEAFVVTPADSFAANVVASAQHLNANYTVDEVPENEVIIQQAVPVRAPTPEEQFMAMEPDPTVADSAEAARLAEATAAQAAALADGIEQRAAAAEAAAQEAAVVAPPVIEPVPDKMAPARAARAAKRAQRAAEAAEGEV